MTLEQEQQFEQQLEQQNAENTGNENPVQKSQSVNQTPPKVEPKVEPKGEEIDKDQLLQAKEQEIEKYKKALKNQSENIPQLRAKAEKVEELQKEITDLKASQNQSAPSTDDLGYDDQELDNLTKALKQRGILTKEDLEVQNQETQKEIDKRVYESFKVENPELYSNENEQKLQESLKVYNLPKTESGIKSILSKAYKDAFPNSNESLIEQGKNQALAEQTNNQRLQMGGGGSAPPKPADNSAYENFKQKNPQTKVTKEQFETYEKSDIRADIEAELKRRELKDKS